jgi:signal transduction histidine kinase/DNA-binding NarL/FixJ family response regulator
MQPELHQHVLRNLHFSLLSKGVLFLGEAETLGDLEEEFKPLHKKGKIYQKRRDIRLPLPIKGVDKITRKLLPQVKPSETQESRLEPILDEAFSTFLADQKATCLLVDREYKLFHIFNNAIEVLKFSTGRTTMDVTKLVPSPLQLPLHTALHRAKRERHPVAYTGIRLTEEENSPSVKLKVTYHETNKLAGDFFMVLIQEDVRTQHPDGERFEAETEASQRIMELEYELQQTRENLQAVIEELETTNEEQQATNEELTASNEELQSTNEELHSVNEELYTVNSEYQSKIEELTELNNDIDNLLRSTDIGVVFLDRDLKIRKFTPAAIVAINLVEADIGRPLEHITYNLDCENLLGLLEGVIDTKKAVEKEVKLIKEDFYLLMRVNPYLQEDGRLDGVVITFVDIDELKSIQQQVSRVNEALKESQLQLQQLNEELEQRVEERTAELNTAKKAAESANQAKSAFIAHISHELRTPLNSILGFTQILQRNPNLDPAEQSKNIDIIYQSGQHLLILINDLLDLAKIEAGKLNLELQDFHFPHFLENIIALEQIRVEQKGIYLNYQVLSPLPTFVHSDETRLRQVLLNLLGNAIKFTETGGVIFKVGYAQDFIPDNQTKDKGQRTKDKIHFQIEDTGIGISEDKLADIFLPFQQVSDRHSTTTGTGLGLTISQKIVHQLGGEIQVISSLGQGSIFWFELNLPEGKGDLVIKQNQSQRQHSVIGYQGKPRQILIVDDRIYNRTILINFLQSIGFQVLEASSGEEAIQVALTRQPDLVLLDLVMPDMDGMEVARQLRQEEKLNNMAIVAISASAITQDHSIYSEIGCQALLNKPIVFEELLDVLETQLKLEWIYQVEEISLQNNSRQNPSPKEVSLQQSQNNILPPKQELESLLNSITQGDIRAVFDQVTSWEQLNSNYSSFTQQIRQLAESFQIDYLQELLQDYVNREQGTLNRE